MIECSQPFIFPNFYLMNSRIHASVEVERQERLYDEILLYLTTRTNLSQLHLLMSQSPFLKVAIDDLEVICMDPDMECHYKDLLAQWKYDEDNIKYVLKGIEKKLDDLMATTKSSTVGTTGKEGLQQQ